LHLNNNEEFKQWMEDTFDDVFDSIK
jgi:hypothetical protein